MIQETTMSDLAVKISPQVSRTIAPLNAPELVAANDSSAVTVQVKIPLTLRSRLKVTRVSPPIDDGFRPFRVF
jgi:hypothetical protein